MKHSLFLLSVLVAFVPAAARAVEHVAPGSLFVVSSYHYTTSDGIQSWGAISLMSPSGQWYSEETHFGSDHPDGQSETNITLNEEGLWQVWNGFGYGAPQSSSTYYQPGTLFQVGYVNQPPTIVWTVAPATSASGQGYTITAHGHDLDGNLSQVQVWKDGQPFALGGGGDGTDSESGNASADTGPQTITYTAQATDAAGATSAVITHQITISAPANQPPSVTLLAPGSQTVTVGSTLTLSAQATDPDGNLIAHNLDIQRPAGDWNWQGGFATGEPFQGGPVGTAADSTRTANFTFTDVGTYSVRSAADDGSGWIQSATVTITVTAPPPTQFTLITNAGSGGTVSAGGTYNAGTVVTIMATPDGTHDFAGWSGDTTGASNPVSLMLDGSKTVQANFAPKMFALSTSATAGGNVTPGGSYPYGASVTVAATPDSTHRFIGWAGDASGTVTSLLLTLTSPLNVQAVFTDKAGQTISFPSPGNQPVGGPVLTLGGTASSGLPITYTILSGPATVAGNLLQITGPGAVTIQANQAGDTIYLPAANVTQTINATVAAILKYRPTSRTLLQDSSAPGSAPFVLENP